VVQPRFVGAEKQSARAQQAVEGYYTRVAIRTSKSQSKSIFSKLEVAIGDIIKALAFYKGKKAVLKGQFPSAYRKPERGRSCGGCGNTGGEVEVVQQRLSERFASCTAGNSFCNLPLYPYLPLRRRKYPSSIGLMQTSLRSSLCRMPYGQHMKDERKEMRL